MLFNMEQAEETADRGNVKNTWIFPPNVWPPVVGRRISPIGGKGEEDAIGRKNLSGKLELPLGRIAQLT